MGVYEQPIQATANHYGPEMHKTWQYKFFLSSHGMLH